MTMSKESFCVCGIEFTIDFDEEERLMIFKTPKRNSSRVNNTTFKDMEKKQPTRDSKGRFMKKENKKAFDYEGAYKQQKEVIADMKKESEYYKELAERLGADYLETCAKLGHVKSSLKAYETCWPKLKKLAKHWRKRALRGEDRYLATLDYLRMAVMQIGCLRHMLPWYKKLIYRSELKLMDEEIERILSGAELLDNE